MASPPPPSPSPPPPAKKLKMSSTTASSEDDEEEHHNGAAEVGAPHPPLPSPAEREHRRRYKRRKVAIFLAYCGAGYQGMQKNPGARTIEGDLEEALFLSGAVPESDRGKPRLYDWARAARTDKGVSAAGQVVSGRFYVDPPGFVDRLNANLPPQIRVFGYRRVTGSFNAKKFCDRRRYVYLLPVFALDPSAHPDRESVVTSLGSENELAKCLECSERGRKVAGLVGRQAGKSCDEGPKPNLGRTEEEEKMEPVGDKAGLEHGDSKSEPIVDANSSSITKVEAEEGIAVVEEEKKAGIPNVSEEERPGLDLGGANAAAPAGIAQSEVSTAKSATEEPESESKSKPGGEHLEETPAAAPPPQTSCGNGGEVELAAARAGEFKYEEKERARFNAILGRYVGTHNFHNFTTRTKAEDPSARRYIVSFDAGAVMDMGGIEFVRCEVVGQSFMLHQIRKMLGLAVAVMRNCTPESMMETALRKDVNINVPTAPEVGLFLDECFFTSYNRKWKDSHEAVSMEAYAEQAEEFKREHILSHIAGMEQREGAVALWLHSLNHRNYPDFRFAEAGGGGGDAEPGAPTGGVAEVEMA